MHLMELLSLRYVAGAGVSFGLTRRCPLHCLHCSTESTLLSEQHDENIFIRFVNSFTPNSRPEVILMSGGEALLRPRLIRKLADKAHECGTRSTLLSGMFFSNARHIPPLIKEAIKAVDHFSASIDAFHEREVPRANVFRVLDTLLNEGKHISLHIAGKQGDDPYLEEIIQDVLQRFNGVVPMLINVISPFGRAKKWLNQEVATSESQRKITAEPCSMAAWPVVGFDGTIVGCGNDEAITTKPKHLILGHANTDSWSTIQRRLNSHTMRAIRLFGPEYIASRYKKTGSACGGYCQTCMKLSNEDTLELQIEEVMNKDSTKILENNVMEMQKEAGAIAFAKSHGIPRYADLVTLGYNR